MKQDTLITVVSKDSSSGHLDDNGVWVQDSNVVTSTYCFIEPYSKQKAIYKYGIDVETNRRVFIDHVEPLIKVGMIIKANNIEYEIKAIPWDMRHMEILALSKESVSS